MDRADAESSERTDSTDEVATVTIDGSDAVLSLPDDTSTGEAAAVAAAIGAHIADRRRAAATPAADTPSPRTVDPWVFADRMRSQGNRHWPREVEQGHEWRAAARSL